MAEQSCTVPPVSIPADPATCVTTTVPLHLHAVEAQQARQHPSDDTCNTDLVRERAAIMRELGRWLAAQEKDASLEDMRAHLLACFPTASIMSRTTLSRALDGHLIVTDPFPAHAEVLSGAQLRPGHVARMLLRVYTRTRIEHAIFVGQVRAGIWTKRTRFVSDTKSLANRRATAPVCQQRRALHAHAVLLLQVQKNCNVTLLFAASPHCGRLHATIIPGDAVTSGEYRSFMMDTLSAAAAFPALLAQSVRSTAVAPHRPSLPVQGLLAFDATRIPRPAELVAPVQARGFTLLPLPIDTAADDPLQHITQLHRETATGLYDAARKQRHVPDGDWEQLMSSRMALLSEVAMGGFATLASDRVKALLRHALLLDDE